jgi:hypothetical protein
LTEVDDMRFASSFAAACGLAALTVHAASCCNPSACFDSTSFRSTLKAPIDAELEFRITACRNEDCDTLRMLSPPTRHQPSMANGRMSTSLSVRDGTLDLEIHVSGKEGEFEEGDRYHVEVVELSSGTVLIDERVTAEVYSSRGSWTCGNDCASAQFDLVSEELVLASSEPAGGDLGFGGSPEN